MSYEVWVFSARPETRPRGGLEWIEVCPPEYGRGDAESLAEKIQHQQLARGIEVSTVVRAERAY